MVGRLPEDPPRVLTLANRRRFGGKAAGIDSADRSIQQERSHALSAFVQWHVSQACNNGWMSALENAVKPILIALVTGDFK